MRNNIKKSSLALAIAASLTLAACGSDTKNSVPTASDLVLSAVSSNSAVTFTDADLLALATDADGDSGLSVESVAIATGGGTLIGAGGHWSYTPAAAEVGAITLTFTITDGAATATASVTFTLSDPSTTVVDTNGIVTVSGKVIDAVTRLPVAGVVVNMMVNGATHTAYSSAMGSYTFKQVTDSTAYDVEVMDSAGMYAVEAAQGTTPTAVANVANQVLSQAVPDFELYKAVATSITVKDINGGSAVEGLSLYYISNGKTVLATEAAGVYTFALANDGNAQAILVQKIVDANGDVYESYNSAVVSPNFANLTPGDDITYYVKSAAQTEFTVYFHVVDDEGHPLDVGNVLTLDEGGVPVYADRKAGTTNEYFRTVTAATMGNDWLIEPIDTDGDGFPDYTANYNVKNTNTNDTEIALGVNNELNRGSFDGNREATLVVPLTPVSYSESIQAEIISSDANFQTNGIAEVIIAFDRPIDLIHQPRMSYQVLAKEDVMRNVEDPASIYNKDFNATVTTDQGDTTLALDTDEDYAYTDKNSAIQKIQLADDNAQIKSPYADDYDNSTSVVVDLTTAQYTMAAGNTLVKITLDASTLKADQTYTFDLAVKGMLDENPVAMMSFTKAAKTSATATLDTIMVDNFDYKQTATKDLLDATKELDIVGQTTHVSKFATLNVGYAGGGLTDLAQLEYLTYGLNGTTVITSVESGINHGLSTLYIVSPAKLEGSIQILSQTEKYTDNGKVVETSFSDTGKFYRLDLAAQSINDDGDLADLTLINSTKTYLLSVPANHGVSGVVSNNGLFNTYTSHPASGADIASEGIYYVYPLTLPTVSGFGDAYVNSVELDFNVEVNGASLTGKKTYVVK